MADYGDYGAGYGGGYGGGGGGGGYDDYGVGAAPAGGAAGGGGGFSQGAQDSSPSGKKGGRGQYSGSTKTLLPVTIALLKSCSPNASGDGFVLPFATSAGAPIDVQYIKIYARVLAKNDADMTKTVFSIHDGSGSLEVTHYHSDDDVYWAEISGQLEPHTYVEAVMIVKAGGGGSDGVPVMSLTLQSLRPVKDSNAITAHMLNVIWTKLVLTRGALPPPSSAGGAAATGHTMATGAFGGASSAYAGALGGGGSRAGATALSASSVVEGSDEERMSLMLTIIRDIVGTSQGEEGASADAVVRRMGGRVTIDQVRDLARRMEDEGMIFQTLDESHWKPCS